MRTHKRSDRHKAKRERRKKRRLARHVQSQLRHDLPKLSIIWDEGVAITVREQARRILNNYYTRKIMQFYKMYHYVMEDASRTLPGCHDADAASIAVEQIRMAISPPTGGILPQGWLPPSLRAGRLFLDHHGRPEHQHPTLQPLRPDHQPSSHLRAANRPGSRVYHSLPR